ncbi:MAG: putative toxin-antitoxin system toxin component, PIN family [Patescibacteria group bacterium]
MIKVVIDTNLLIDGSADEFNFGNRIVDEVIEGRIQAFANVQTLKENRFIAQKKITDGDYLDKLTRYFEKVKIVENGVRLRIVEDPDDNKLLESAIAANAEYLISSDKHLLNLEKFQNVKIVAPAHFWNIYQEESGETWKQWLGQFIR